MRLKNVWSYVPIPAKLKLFAERITLSKLTIFYFTFSVLHCLIQVVFQVEAFKVNEDAANFLNHVIRHANVSERGFTVLKGNTLRWCTSIPNTFDASECEAIWNGTQTSAPNITVLNSAASSLPEEYSVNTTISNLPVSSSSSSAVSSPISTSSRSATVLSSSIASSSPVVTPAASITNLGQLQSALQSIEAGAIVVTERPSAPTITITVQSAATQVIHSDDVHEHRKRGLTSSTKVISNLAVDGSKEVRIQGLPGYPNQDVTLSEDCLLALNWPLSRVDDTKREDIVFIGFSVWVLGMSLVALLNESPPHIVASFLTHCLATGWSAYQLASTQSFHSDFARIVTRGACGINLLPIYWNKRAQFEIPTLAFNALALIISAVLSWRLMKSFGWQTFKRIGASLTISRAYRIVLIFSIVIQLSVFFVVVSVALWVDQIYNGNIGSLTGRAEMFKGLMIAVLLLMLPWLTIGWISVRREHKIPMIIFLVLSLGYTAGWSSMFAAPSFRWTYVEWFFFSLMATASVVLAFATFVLGIICRCNFGKGLNRYLNAQQPLPGDDFEPAYFPSSPTSASRSYISDKQWGSDEEKVDFPSYDTSVPIPTYAQVPAPAPAYMQNAPRVLGPRFYQASMGQSFDQTTMRSDATRTPLSRQTSGSSQHSVGSVGSVSSDSFSTMRGKRWIIE